MEACTSRGVDIAQWETGVSVRCQQHRKRTRGLTTSSLGSTLSSSLSVMLSMMVMNRLILAELSFSWPGGISALLNPGIMPITCAGLSSASGLASILGVIPEQWQ